MPSISFASGILDGYAGAITKKKEDEQRNALDAAKFLLSTGRVKDVNDILPILSPIFGDQKGKGGKGGKGGQDPHSILAQFMNPALQMAHQAKTAGGQNQPSFQPPPEKPLYTEDEFAAREQKAADTAATHKSDLETEGKIKVDRAEYQDRVKRGREQGLGGKELAEYALTGKLPPAKVQFTPGSVPGSSLPPNSTDIYGQPVDPAKHYRQGSDGTGQATFVPTETPASAISKQRLTGAAAQAVDEVLMKQGVDPMSIQPTDPRYHAAMQEAARLLSAKRNLDAASRNSLLQMRNWMLGTDIGGGAGGGSGAGGGKQQPPDDRKPSQTAPAPSTATGEAVLEKLPPAEAAEVRQVAQYRKALPARYFNSPRGAKILGLVEQYTGKTFDQTIYQQRQRGRIAFTSGKSGDNIRSLNTAAVHLGTLADKATALNNSDIQLWNKIANKGLEETGDPRVDGFLTAANAVAGELSTLFKGTAGTDTEIKNWRARINQAKSPQQLQEVLKTAAELAEGRLSALKGQWQSTMGDTPFDVVTPEAEKALSRLGLRIRQGGASSDGGDIKVGDFTVRVKKPAA